MSFVRSAEGLYVNTTWEEFEDAFKQEDEFVAVSGVELCKCSVWACGLVPKGRLAGSGAGRPH